MPGPAIYFCSSYGARTHHGLVFTAWPELRGEGSELPRIAGLPGAKDSRHLVRLNCKSIQAGKCPFSVFWWGNRDER